MGEKVDDDDDDDDDDDGDDDMHFGRRSPNVTA
jgi:hypothetical protein